MRGGDALYQTRSAAGNIGDIIVVDSAKINDCVNAGLIRDITDLVKDKNNLAKYQPAIDALKKSLNTERVYGIRITSTQESPLTPGFVGMEPFTGSYLRLDYYNDLGRPTIKGMNCKSLKLV